MNQKDFETFSKAVETLRQYRKYDEIVDEKNNNILYVLYVDPIEEMQFQDYV